MNASDPLKQARNNTKVRDQLHATSYSIQDLSRIWPCGLSATVLRRLSCSATLKMLRNPEQVQAAEELANELKRVLENSIGDSAACLCDDKCNAAAYGTHTAGLRQESQRSQTSSAAASDASLVGIEQIAMVHLQNGCDDVDLLRKRMLQQLEVRGEASSHLCNHVSIIMRLCSRCSSCKQV